MNLRATAPPPPLGPPTRNHPMKKRANVTIATLNINGACTPTANLNLTDKWLRINTTMRENKIAFLALQETHLDEERANTITRRFGRSLSLLYSGDPDTP
jgi:hypothetical protein